MQRRTGFVRCSLGEGSGYYANETRNVEHMRRSGNNSRRVTGYRFTSLDCLDCRPFGKIKKRKTRVRGTRATNEATDRIAKRWSLVVRSRRLGQMKHVGHGEGWQCGGGGDGGREDIGTGC